MDVVVAFSEGCQGGATGEPRNGRWSDVLEHKRSICTPRRRLQYNGGHDERRYAIGFVVHLHAFGPPTPRVLYIEPDFQASKCGIRGSTSRERWETDSPCDVHVCKKQSISILRRHPAEGKSARTLSVTKVRETKMNDTNAKQQTEMKRMTVTRTW